MEQFIVDDEPDSLTPTTKLAPLWLPYEASVLDGRYRVRRPLGHGGMADVYLADDLLLERMVAIKVLHQDIAMSAPGRERFRREAIALAAVASPHIVGIHDVRLEGPGPYLVMPYIEGHTIEDEIEMSGPMSRPRAGAVLGQLLEGLAELHSQGLVHRDIKPVNVLIDSDDRVVLVDLGIVFDAEQRPLTSPGLIAGTPGYLAPELGSDLTGDIYQVGLLMLFVLTGVDPGRGSFPPQFDDLLEQLPPAIAAVAGRALARDPAERFRTAEEMKLAVEVVLRSISPGAGRDAATMRVCASGTGSGDHRTVEIPSRQLLGLVASMAPEHPRDRIPTTPDPALAALRSLRGSGASEPRVRKGERRVRMRLESLKPVEHAGGASSVGVVRASAGRVPGARR